MFLDKFRAAKMPEIEVLRELQASGALPAPVDGGRPDFLRALMNPRGGKPVAIIAEFKQASPSRGPIHSGLSPEDAAAQYADNGADCVSVLTEREYFGGELDYLSRMTVPGVPLLRKDFIFDPLQVAETAATPASAMLLIVRMTPEPLLLKSLREMGEYHGIHAVVEIFNREDLDLARQSGARIIQVNARDLDTLKTDRKACLELAADKLDGEIWIAASGMETGEHILEAAAAGYDAVLIGTALMEGGTPGAKLASLVEQLTRRQP